MKRLAVGLLLIAACAAEPPDLSPGWTRLAGSTYYQEVHLPNGRVVTCISGGTSLSCDWSER